MKGIKILGKAMLVACVLLSALCAHGQTYVSNEAPFFDTRKSENFLEVGAHVTLGISSIIQNYSKAVTGISDFQISPGFMGTIGVDVRFNLRNSLGLCTGLDFGINNFRYAMSTVDMQANSFSSMYSRNHFYHFKVPVYVSFRFNVGRRLTWCAEVGAYFSKGFGGYTKVSGYTSGDNQLGQPTVAHGMFESKYFNADTPFINGVRSTDWGPRFSTGFMYKRKYSLKMVLDMSIPNLALNKGVMNVRYRNLTWGMQVGYVF